MRFEAHGRAAHPPSTGHDLHMGRRQNARTVGAQSRPEVVILGCTQGRPASATQIRIRSYAQVRSVHVTMGSVRMKQIG
jgi:hypothetical protein